jgi:hypothetical protein
MTEDGDLLAHDTSGSIRISSEVNLYAVKIFQVYVKCSLVASN